MIKSKKSANIKSSDRQALEKAALQMVHDSIKQIKPKAVVRWYNKEGNTIVFFGDNRDQPRIVTNTIAGFYKKGEDERNNLAEVTAYFNENAKRFSLFRSATAATLYKNCSHAINAYLAKEALLAVIKSFGSKEDTIKQHSKTAAEILKIYNAAVACKDNMTWEKALMITENLLADNLEKPVFLLCKRHKDVEESYSKALDIIQANYHVKQQKYFNSNHLVNVTENGFMAQYINYDFLEYSKNTHWKKVKSKIEQKIESLIFCLSENNTEQAKLDALPYLSYHLFKLARGIWPGQRNNSRLYQETMLMIAKLHGYDISKLALVEQETIYLNAEEEKAYKSQRKKIIKARENLIEQVETYMKANLTVYKVRAEKFDSRYKPDAVLNDSAGIEPHQNKN